MVEHYPALYSKAFPTFLYLGGSLRKVWCETGGWMAVLRNKSLLDVSSRSLQDYQFSGVSDYPLAEFFSLS